MLLIATLIGFGIYYFINTMVKNAAEAKAYRELENEKEIVTEKEKE